MSEPNSSPAASPVTLFVCEQIREEPFFPDLERENYRLVFFNRDRKGWVDQEAGGVYFIDERLLIHEFLGLLDIFFMAPDQRPVIVIGEMISREYLSSLFKDRPFFYLTKPLGLKQITETIRLCAETAEKGRIAKQYERELWRAQREIGELHTIGMALSSENDPDRLLKLILTKSRELIEADAGSLYLVESEKSLRFKLSQNSSLDWQVSESLLMPINDLSIAGTVALSSQPINLLDCYFIPPTFKFTFNKSFDEKSGYRTKSMLAVPMKNQGGEVLGVIQLINKRKDFEHHHPGEPLREDQIIPFSRKDLDLLASLASQAAIALENSRLYTDIKNLFEGFVKASVTAIEQRDPTTCGHSERVAALTVAFAEKLNTIEDGPFAAARFDERTMTEIRYASLLHDFGKVGVREEILVKAKKLFPHELEAMRMRFRLIGKSMESDFYRHCLEICEKSGLDTYLSMKEALEANFKMEMEEIDGIFRFLVQANEPTILEEGNFHHLLEIAKRQYRGSDSQMLEFLTERETHVLSIRKGSLSEAERIEIESHVTHTFNFLSKIPWGKKLRRVPEIAYSHHEKLNGRGYPNHLDAGQIPIESKLMTICDIYDALTAQDRPYKRALPKEKAFDIMYNEAKLSLLSPELLDIFVQGGVYKVIEGKTRP